MVVLSDKIRGGNNLNFQYVDREDIKDTITNILKEIKERCTSVSLMGSSIDEGMIEEISYLEVLNIFKQNIGDTLMGDEQ